jgi:hypothetical protein
MVLRYQFWSIMPQKRDITSSKELPSVHEALEKLRNAIIALETPGLDQCVRCMGRDI